MSSTQPSVNSLSWSHTTPLSPNWRDVFDVWVIWCPKDWWDSCIQRSLVNSSAFLWSVMSSASQGKHWDQWHRLCNQASLQLSGAVDAWEGRDAAQRDLNRLMRQAWTCVRVIPNIRTHYQMNGLGATLQKKIWRKKSSSQASNVQLQPRKPTQVLHQENKDQQIRGGDRLSPVHSYETPFGVLDPSTGSQHKKDMDF